MLMDGTMLTDEKVESASNDGDHYFGGRQILFDPRMPTSAAKYSCYRAMSLVLDQEVVGEWIRLDNSTYPEKIGQALADHDSWSCIEIALCEIEASEENVLVKILSRSTNASLVRKRKDCLRANRKVLKYISTVQASFKDQFS